MGQHNLVKHSGIVNTCSACDYNHPAKVRKHFKQVHLNIKRKNEARMDSFETDCKNKEKEYCEGMAHNRVLCKQCDFFLQQKEP